MKRVLKGIFGRTGNVDRWALVDRVGSAIRSSLHGDLDEVLRAAVEELGRALGASRCAVALNRDGEIQYRTDYTAPRIRSLVGLKSGLAQTDIAHRFFGGSDLVEVSDVQKSAREQGVSDLLLDDKVKSALVVPLVINARTIGAIIIHQCDKKRRWSTTDKQLVQVIASNLALAIYQFELYEKTRKAAEREALTSRLLAAIRTAPNVSEILKVAVEGIGEALSVSRAAIYSHPPAEANGNAGSFSSIRVTAQYLPRHSIPGLLGHPFEIHESPLLSRLLSGEIISIPDTGNSDPVVRAVAVRQGCRALTYAPISYNGRPAAVLALEQFECSRAFSEEEIGLVKLVADQTAVALHRDHLYREAEARVRREELIGRIGAAIHSSLDQETVLQTIVNELGAALGVCRCRLALMPSPLPDELSITHEYVAACCAGRNQASDTIQVKNNPLLQAVLSTPQAVAVDDVLTEPMLAPLRDTFRSSNMKSVLGTAIWLGGRPLGVISLRHCESKHHWTTWEIKIAQSVAEQAAVAIRQAELYREARESATRATLVNQIVASIRRSLDLEETLQVTVEELGHALKASRVIFRKLVNDEVSLVAEYLSKPDLSLQGVPVAAGDYKMQYMVETGRTLIVEDVRAFVAAHPELTSSVNVWHVEAASQSEIVCPIFVNGRFWGSLSINQTDYPRKWSPSEITFVEAVTGQVEVAVSHSHLFAEAKHAVRREELISSIIHGINQSNQLDEIFQIVTAELGDYMGVNGLVIARFNEHTGVWSVQCEYRDGRVSGSNLNYQAVDFEGLIQRVENGPFLCNDVYSDPRVAQYLDSFLEPAGTRSFMVVPVFYKAAPRLCIIAIMRDAPREWSDESVEIASAVADQLFTALERAELFDQISRGKHEWEATFDALNDGIFIFDRMGILRRVNQAAAILEKADVDDLIGRKCCTLLQGLEGNGCRVIPVMESRQPVTFELVPERLSRSMLVTISPLESTAADGPFGAVCIVRDLSELRAAEAAAREQRNFLIKLIEHANDAIFALSPEGRFIWFNEQLVKLSGYPREELLATDYRQFLPHEDKKLAVERFTRALQGEAQTLEIRGLKRSGESRLLLVTYTPIYDEGRVSSVLSIARDITEERMAAERAAQADKLRALGQLASGVAHNFNNILAAILGHAQLMKREIVDERAASRIDIIERAAMDGAQTVKRIQVFALQQSETVREQIDVDQLVQDSTNLTRARWRDEAQARGLHYEVETVLRGVPLTLGNASEMREVFVNIILNALDAMPQGGKLIISTESSETWMLVSFSDNGIGMSREIRERVFEPFFTTKRTTGTGLGLAVSHSIIERHGGRIEANSLPGRGSTFVIALPVQKMEGRPAGMAAARQIRSANILVIDDDERVREALAGMLNSTGHRTELAASGPEGLFKLEGGCFDVVFTDLSMPEMDGWVVALEIRRRWPDVKIVLATGYALSEDMLDRHRGLVDAVIIKPIQIDEISNTLGQIIS